MTEPATARPTLAWPAWPLPLLAGLLPLVATLVGYSLSVRLGLVEACNPFVDGCVSISRAARFDLPNHLFRALLLPAAALQALCWLLCGAWLRTLGAARTRKPRALLALCAALPLLGLANAFAPLLHVDGETREALQNSTEWWGGLIFTLFFVAIAWLWRATHFEIRFAMR